MRELIEIQSLLHAYRDFSECVVDGIEIHRFARSLQVKVDYVWLPSGAIRPDSSERLKVYLRFDGVRRFVIDNPGIPQGDLGWSHAEVALVQAAAANEEGLLEVRFWFEESTWIHVVFAEMSTEERAEPAASWGW